MVKKRNSDWPDEDIALLKKLWAEPVGTKEIGQRLSVPRTKSAVCGKADRLKAAGELGEKVPPPTARRKKTRGLGIQVRKVKKATARKPKKVEKPAPPAKPKLALVPEGTAVIPPRPARLFATAELKRGMCRWPYGDPNSPDFGHCGCRAEAGVYCISHALVAYKPPEKRLPTRPVRVYRRRA
ncbi:putative GcrA-like cell cycle regulator [Caulobacter virus Karma]|uniref:Putative GcrA-like cell cycle regulator n=1 Tax=Caulobacter phage CcrSwift TaxID=2927984 RepID=K4K7D4_9CAUD|nr:putative GcrA-like cell cycle regulator [Caulobacter virus Magneto]YP_006989614.1 putative GcrA-like cell cycle regulator [Caulobacter virus Karma]YP_006989962.1 putative GcrA-like cell cycle regulator [Caulobacter phage CcrSwift]ARB13757.1 GcrA cell cycle regulator [Caulobacter phage Ccr10]ARB14102.1 GcrA cell cycle regulator [Caulobacter phage Ccr2]ARB14444.1 GcrA cell cycle regulator [Caulobacter phage Ccr5]ARB14791.1 GcrA cell cycle regulator [Caulobacter phage Ccr29]AFU87399.1 putati